MAQRRSTECVTVQNVHKSRKGWAHGLPHPIRYIWRDMHPMHSLANGYDSVFPSLQGIQDVQNVHHCALGPSARL